MKRQEQDRKGRRMMSEEMKLYPFGIVWEEYCARSGMPAHEEWYADIVEYEQNVQSKRV